MHLELRNLGRQRSPSLRLWEPVGVDGGAPMQIASLAPGDHAGAAYRVPTERRGVVHLGPIEATRSDVLGLASRRFTIAGSSTVLVVPSLVTLAVPRVGAAGALGQHLRTRAYGRTGSEFHSMREYSPGDDLRQVSWKASARSTTLLVKQTEQEGLRHATVVLDASAERYPTWRPGARPDEDTFERAVVAAASLVAALSTELTTRFVSVDCDLAGPTVDQDSLAWLAQSTPTTAPLKPPARRGMAEQLGVVVVVTPHADGSARALRESVGTIDQATIVVAVGGSTSGVTSAAGGLGPATMVVDASSVAAFVGGWSRLIGGDS